MKNAESKALIALLTMAYQIDNKLETREADLMDSIVNAANEEWDPADISLKSFIGIIRAESIHAIDHKAEPKFVKKYLRVANNPDTIKALVNKMVAADEVITTREQDFLRLIEAA